MEERDPAAECHGPAEECRDLVVGCPGLAAGCHVRLAACRGRALRDREAWPAAAYRGPAVVAEWPARARRISIDHRWEMSVAAAKTCRALTFQVAEHGQACQVRVARGPRWVALAVVAATARVLGWSGRHCPVVETISRGHRFLEEAVNVRGFSRRRRICRRRGPVAEQVDRAAVIDRR